MPTPPRTILANFYAGRVLNSDDTPIAPSVSTFPKPRGYRMVGSRAEKVIVLNVRMSLRISAAE